MGVKPLTFSPFGNSSYRCFTVNNVHLGTIYQEVDGYYVFEFNKTIVGYIPDYMMMELAVKLKDLNHAWDCQIKMDLARLDKPSRVPVPGDLF